MFSYIFFLMGLCLPLTLARDALVIIDVQNDFTPGGAIPVPEGDGVTTDINNLRSQHVFDEVVLTQDWHCDNHVSFASQHEGYSSQDVVKLEYNSQGELCRTENVTNEYTVNCTEVRHHVGQVVWPDHAVINSKGAEFHPKLDMKDTDTVIRKGYKCHVDSYSAFYDNGGFTQTEMHEFLQNSSVDTVYFTGLALDYCVSWSAMDAKKLGYQSLVIMDATRGITEDGASKAIEDMKAKGVELILSSDLVNAASGSFYHIKDVLMLAMMMSLLHLVFSHFY